MSLDRPQWISEKKKWAMSWTNRFNFISKQIINFKASSCLHRAHRLTMFNANFQSNYGCFRKRKKEWEKCTEAMCSYGIDEFQWVTSPTQRLYNSTLYWLYYNSLSFSRSVCIISCLLFCIRQSNWKSIGNCVRETLFTLLACFNGKLCMPIRKGIWLLLCAVPFAFVHFDRYLATVCMASMHANMLQCTVMHWEKRSDESSERKT